MHEWPVEKKSYRKLEISTKECFKMTKGKAKTLELKPKKKRVENRQRNAKER